MQGKNQLEHSVLLWVYQKKLWPDMICCSLGKQLCATHISAVLVIRVNLSGHLQYVIKTWRIKWPNQKSPLLYYYFVPTIPSEIKFPTRSHKGKSNVIKKMLKETCNMIAIRTSPEQSFLIMDSGSDHGKFR